MEMSDLLSKFKNSAEFENINKIADKISSTEEGRKIIEKVVNNKELNATATKIQKTIKSTAKSLGIDVDKIISLATKNKDIIDLLAKIGLKKENLEPDASSVQKIVGNLKTAMSKAVGVKIDDKTFSNVANKLLKNDTVKSKVEKIAGSGVSTYIKKAISEYVS